MKREVNLKKKKSRPLAMSILENEIWNMSEEIPNIVEIDLLLNKYRD